METRRVILDTSAYSAFLKGEPSIKRSLQEADEIYMNPVILGELLAGFAAGSHEKRNRNILREFFSSPRVKFVEMDEETSERYAVIFKHLRSTGSPVPTNDLWIAASAMQYGLKVITTDGHYLKIPHIMTEHHPA